MKSGYMVTGKREGKGKRARGTGTRFNTWCKEYRTNLLVRGRGKRGKPGIRGGEKKKNGGRGARGKLEEKGLFKTLMEGVKKGFKLAPMGTHFEATLKRIV